MTLLLLPLDQFFAITAPHSHNATTETRLFTCQLPFLMPNQMTNCITALKESTLVLKLLKIQCKVAQNNHDTRERLTLVCCFRAAANAGTATDCWKTGVDIWKRCCVNRLDSIWHGGSSISISYRIWLSHTGCTDRRSLTVCWTKQHM